MNLENLEIVEFRILAPQVKKKTRYKFMLPKNIRRFRFRKNSVTSGILPLIEKGLEKINNR